jgi:hypothetical protein
MIFNERRLSNALIQFEEKRFSMSSVTQHGSFTVFVFFKDFHIAVVSNLYKAKNYAIVFTVKKWY